MGHRDCAEKQTVITRESLGCSGTPFWSSLRSPQAAGTGHCLCVPCPRRIRIPSSLAWTIKLFFSLPSLQCLDFSLVLAMSTTAVISSGCLDFDSVVKVMLRPWKCCHGAPSVCRACCKPWWSLILTLIFSGMVEGLNFLRIRICLYFIFSQKVVQSQQMCHLESWVSGGLGSVAGRFASMILADFCNLNDSIILLAFPIVA